MEIDGTNIDLNHTDLSGKRLGSDGDGQSLPARPATQVLRCVAGFPKEPGQYHLPRATIEPPEVLHREIYPFVEEWRRRFHARPDDPEEILGSGRPRLSNPPGAPGHRTAGPRDPTAELSGPFSLPLFQRQEWVDTGNPRLCVVVTDLGFLTRGAAEDSSTPATPSTLYDICCTQHPKDSFLHHKIDFNV